MSTLGAQARSRPGLAVDDHSGLGALHSIGLSIATAVVVMALVLLPLLTPFWIHFAMSASGGHVAGATQAQSFALSDQTVNELIFGPGTFTITYAGGQPLFGADEIGHMQDVRLVLWAFLAIAALAAALLALAVIRRGGPPMWRAVGRGGAGLVIGLVGAGAFAALAFGVAFELFHRILFPGGNWAFDPAQSNLVRMYPLGFWQLSAAAYGILGIAGGVIVWLLGRRGAQRGKGVR
jgi:hypothetical protein